MAKMTKVAYKAIRKVRPQGGRHLRERPDLTGRTATTRVADPYFAALKKMKWPVTHMSGHFYPAGQGGAEQAAEADQPCSRSR